MNNFLQSIRKIFLTGLFAAAPIALTVYIIGLIFRVLDKPTATFLKQYQIEIPGLGIIISVTLVFLLGIFTTNVLGKRLFAWGEKYLASLPIINPIYNTIKQITTAFSGSSSRAFRKVVYIEYPRKNLWTIAFVTADSTNPAGQEFYHLFVPTTPNPTSGFYLIIPKGDAIESTLNVEEGLKTVISGGALAGKKTPIFTGGDRPADSGKTV
ncbi:MAG: DUF502 domain-containing protein [Candidatus Neomarinimicrobiota bacterium]